ncbi:hypothetical protein P0136_10475 [Lentisphaerota bacterium ZTH]|nr:hypothetical protein JYG24_12015 [Lentisphaerota bacterium]WET05786.1 hypothetical protein P0136_10475 [Lentisphaerota bacterium ZTH]
MNKRAVYFRRGWKAFGALATGVLFLMVVRVNSLSPGTANCIDCFYHVAVARQGPAVFTAKTFPAASASLWATTFSDKELLFHWLLYGGGEVFNVLGGDAYSPPFHALSLLITGITLALFVLTAYRLGVRKQLFSVAALLVLFPTFTHRFLMLRPHVLSTGLMLLAAVACDYALRKEQYWPLLLAGFCYAWGYSNPHFILIPAIAFGIGWWARKGSRVWLPAFFGGAGVLTGFIMHPQFPNTFIVWKVQCVDVILNRIAGVGVIGTPSELGAPPLMTLLQNAVLPLLLFFNLLILLLLMKKYGAARLPPSLTGLNIISLIFTGGWFVSVRCIEYAAPFTILAFFVSLRYVAALWKWRAGLTARRLRLFMVEIAVFFFITAFAAGKIYIISAQEYRPASGFAAWLESRQESKEQIIANLIWSDFPFLYYAAPDYYYLSALDPMFTYAVNPGPVSHLESLLQQRKIPCPQEVSRLTGARLFFVSWRYPELQKKLKCSGYKVVYQGADGMAFSI